MKTTLIIAVLLFSGMSMGQLTGEVGYTTTVNMHKGLPDDERGKRMKSFIPETTDFSNQLLFNDGETVYKNMHDEEEEPDLDAASGASGSNRGAKWKKHMMKRMAPPNDIIYTDAKTGIVTQKKEFMDKVFLIRDTVEMSSWKLTGETKEVSGMNCMKAVYIVEEKDTTVEEAEKGWNSDIESVEAWFTPELPISSGPAGYGGLPGLILHLNINDGGMVIALNNIVMREIEDGEIVAPKKGKEVTQEEFDELVKKKREQERQQRSGGGDFHRH